MKFNNVFRPLYLETNASGANLGADILQVRYGMKCGYNKVADNATLCPIVFTSKDLSSTEWHYSSAEYEDQGILHGLEKLHQYCFARDVPINTYHKPLVAVISKDVMTLS